MFSFAPLCAVTTGTSLSYRPSCFSGTSRTPEAAASKQRPALSLLRFLRPFLSLFGRRGPPRQERADRNNGEGAGKARARSGGCAESAGPRKQDGESRQQQPRVKTGTFLSVSDALAPVARSSFLRVIATLRLATLFGLGERDRLCFDKLSPVLLAEGEGLVLDRGVAGRLGQRAIGARAPDRGGKQRRRGRYLRPAASSCGVRRRAAASRAAAAYATARTAAGPARRRVPVVAAALAGHGPLARWRSRFTQRGLREAVQGPSFGPLHQTNLARFLRLIGRP